MKRDFLKDMGLSDEQINSVMAENGKDIEATKAKFADYDDLKAQLKTANDTMDKFKDYDQTKADVEKYKAELKKAQDESASKIARMERLGRIKDFTGSKKFVNDFTRDSINSLIEAEMEKDDKKDLKDIFDAITKDKTNILVEENKPAAPVVSGMKDENATKSALSEINKARSVMGLTPKTE